MTRILLILLLSLTAFGQPSPINRRAFALAGLASSVVPPTPQTILSNMYFWWNGKDLVDGSTVTGPWNDRIQNIPIAQGNATIAPTNNIGLGVWFSGTTYLTNVTTTSTAWAGAGNNPSLVLTILKPYTVSGDAVAIGDTDRGLGTLNGTSLRYAGIQSGGPNTICSLKVTNMVDVYVYLTSSNTTWFTNAVPVRTNSTGNYDFIHTHYLGRAGSGFANQIGFIPQHMCWTNVPMSTVYAVIADLHKWVTNTYGTNIVDGGIYP